MTGLQCGILTVVDEAEQFARVWQMFGGPVGKEMAQHAQGEHCGCRRPAFARKTGEAIDVFSGGVEILAAVDAESELAGGQPVIVAADRHARGLTGCRCGTNFL